MIYWGRDREMPEGLPDGKIWKDPEVLLAYEDLPFREKPRIKIRRHVRRHNRSPFIKGVYLGQDVREDGKAVLRVQVGNRSYSIGGWKDFIIKERNGPVPSGIDRGYKGDELIAGTQMQVCMYFDGHGPYRCWRRDLRSMGLE